MGNRKYRIGDRVRLIKERDGLVAHEDPSKNIGSIVHVLSGDHSGLYKYLMMFDVDRSGEKWGVTGRRVEMHDGGGPYGIHLNGAEKRCWWVHSDDVILVEEESFSASELEPCSSIEPITSIMKRLLK